MQKLIEDITGESYAALAEKHIFAPLGMTTSSFEIKSLQLPHDNIKEGHLKDGNMVPGGWHNYPESAAAGLWTTAEDLAKFNLAVQKAFRGEDNHLLTKEMAQAMLMQQSNNEFGLGFVVHSFDSEPKFAFEHDGSNEGYLCRYIGLPNQASGVVIMTNSDNGNILIGEILRGMYKEYPGVFVSKQKIPMELDTKILTKCIGEFTIPEFENIVIKLSLENKHLFLAYFKNKKLVKIKLTAESATEFFNAEEDLELKFSANYNELTVYGAKGIKNYHNAAIMIFLKKWIKNVTKIFNNNH